ncbi:MAG: SAF domain-containing protein [Jiangellaceae bacterium]
MSHTATGPIAHRSLSSPPADAPSPKAARLARPRWLDPRLVTGVLLVLGSVVVGTRVITAADDTVPVLVAATDLAPGQPLTEAMVQTRNVILEGNIDLYYTGSVGDGYIVVRPVGEGELLPRAAVASAADGDAVRYVTVAVPSAEVPIGIGAGTVVDVWRAASEQDAERTATRILAAVTVTAADSGGGGLAGTGSEARVTLAVAGGNELLEESTAALVAAARDGLVYLTEVPEAQR